MNNQDQLKFDPQNFDWNDAYSGSADDYEPPDELIVATTASLPPGRALDVGCGAGGLIVALAKQGWQADGIDGAAKAIAAAGKVVAKHGVSAELEVADARHWRPQASYDLVTNSFALPMTVAKRRPVYAMIRDALAPGGSVIIKDFDPQMSRFPHFGGECGIDMVSPEELLEAFAGFDIVRAEVVDTPVHHHAGHDRAAEAWTATFFHARKPK